jgi:hypothetical protein
MKSHESTPAADQGVSRDATEQLSGDWRSHLIDFNGPGFLEYHRVGVACPLVVSAGRAFVRGARLVKRLGHSLKVVLTAVPFHDDDSIPRDRERAA